MRVLGIDYGDRNVGLALSDRLARRYEGHDQEDRDTPREIIVVSLDRVRAALG